jgi:hypothetical protein
VLEPGDAWLRVAPIDKDWRQERVRVALPQPVPTSDELAIERAPVRITPSDNASDSKANTARRQYPNDGPGDAPRVVALPAGAARLSRGTARAHGRGHPHEVHSPMASEASRAGAVPGVDGRADDGQQGAHTYGRFYDAAIGRTDYTHRVVWRRVYGAIPAGLTVDHVCNVTLCHRPDHLQLLTKPNNTRRRHQR